MSALREIVDRYERRLLCPNENCESPKCSCDRSLISRARAELERGVDVSRLLHESGFCDEFGYSPPLHKERMAEALRDQGVNVKELALYHIVKNKPLRVVEDGKEPK